MNIRALICILLWPAIAVADLDPTQLGQVLAHSRVKNLAYVESVVLAANAAATPEFPAELLLSMADIESDFRPNAVSRLVDGVRQTGVWASDQRPPRATGNFFCGITQAMASTWKRCLELRDPTVAFSTTVSELTAWLKRAKTLQRALQGYGCGNIGMTGACRRYATRVLRRVRVFRPGQAGS